VSRSWLLYLDDLIGSAEKLERFVTGRTLADFISIAHRYFALDAEIIWEVASTHVPKMIGPDASAARPVRQRRT
jgi:uncharacterized protein with HEPN domain